MTVVAVPLAGAFGALLGPWLLRLVFGSTVDVTSEVAAVLAAGSTLAVANVVLMVAALAGDQPLRVALAWAAAVAVGAAAMAVLTGSSAVTRTSVTFLAVEVAATVALAVVAWGSLRLGRSQRA